MSREYKRVRCITLGTVYKSLQEAEEITGIKYQNISNACRGVIKTAGKIYGQRLRWEYVDEAEERFQEFKTAFLERQEREQTDYRKLKRPIYDEDGEEVGFDYI